MAKQKRPKQVDYRKPSAKPVDIGKFLNFPGPSVRGRFWRELAEEVRDFPAGRQTAWGIPFEMAGKRAGKRVIALRAGEEVRKGAGRLVVKARVEVSGSGWIAARCSGAGETPAHYMAAHTSPVYIQCGRETPFDGPALEHMLNLTRGGIEYLETISTRFDDREQERMIRIYREVEEHLRKRLELGR